jgi:hypothetical protein
VSIGAGVAVCGAQLVAQLASNLPGGVDMPYLSMTLGL